MYRIILFLVLIALAAAGAAWVADQTGDVALSWDGWRLHTTLPVFALALGVAIVAAILAWSILRALWRLPERIRRSRRERRHARGRHAITQGLLAIGHGDSTAARMHADVARRHAADDPLALLLHAQSAQLDGDRDSARAAFRAMAERKDTRLLGLRGLFIEAQRADDAVAAVGIAEEALRLSPSSTWASHAVLGFRCARGDWSGALSILDNNLASGLIDKPAYRRQRGVLLTARALELETVDRDLSREAVMEAIKLVPTLVPAAVLAARYQSEAHQIRRAMRIVEAAWLAHPHPDLADAYAHVKLGDSARQRLVRVETLAAKAPGHLEGALAVARAAIDASEFARAREALGAVHRGADATRGDADGGNRAHRTWRQRKSAGVDLARGARIARSGLDRGRLCFRSLAAGVAGVRPARCLPVADAVVGAAVRQASARSRPRRSRRRCSPPRHRRGAAKYRQRIRSNRRGNPRPKCRYQRRRTILRPPRPSNRRLAPAPAPPPTEAVPAAAPPLFRARADLPKMADKPAGPAIPAVIPIVRAPDDPGIDDEPGADEFAEQIAPAQGQAGGWRGFLSRWGG